MGDGDGQEQPTAIINLSSIVDGIFIFSKGLYVSKN